MSAKKIGIIILGIGLVLAIIFVLLSSPIDGTWSASGQVGEGFSWTKTYSFNKLQYKMEGYPTISEEGSFKIIKTDANLGSEKKYTVRLTPSDHKTPYEIEILFVPGSKTLRLDKDTYSRVN